MVSTLNTLNLEEKYNRVRRNFCFYLDIQDHGLARSLSRRLQDMGLQQEVFLTSRVTHVVRCGGAGGASGGAGGEAAGGAGGGARCSRARAEAMIQRLRHRDPTAASGSHVVHLTVQKAISLLDKLYDTFFAAPRKLHVKLFSKPFIKIEFLDKICRPVFKEFDEWPFISLEPDPPKEKKKDISPVPPNDINQNPQVDQKMTKKSRPRVKDREEKEPKGGYCEMCNADYEDAALHRRSPHHLAFVRDHTNFLALDSLIGSGADVTTFLDKATPINGERRSLRNMCNGELEQPKTKRSKRSQSPDSTLNGNSSPKRNGIEDERKHNTRCNKKSDTEDKKYYKVVGVSTKLRSSGGFQVKRKDSLPTCNGAKPLVVKFRQVRRSELSVLSDEAEQFMFPKRASSTSSTSSDDEKEVLTPRRKTPQTPPQSTERRRQARPLALKEESSEEDGWPEDKRPRKRRAAPVKRGRRLPLKPQSVEAEPDPEPPPPPEETPQQEDISPLREEPVERCMKWEDGKLKYTPAVEQLEFAFESVPRSEPWYETFKRQDQDKVLTKNVPQFFELYAQSPKLPYEIGQLPPLKPNCCPLSDLVKREDKAGPSRSYGTRGMKKQKIRKRTAALIALESHPRKSPREHASTLAILGSVGLLHRRKHIDDTKSTASEDTTSDTISNVKAEHDATETQEASERLQQFLSEVFDDAAEFEVSDEIMEGEAALTTCNAPDVSSLVSECEDCDLIRKEIKENAEAGRVRRGKFKKKNRTGWPNKKKNKGSRTNSLESQKTESVDRSSAELHGDTTQDNVISEEDSSVSETEIDKTVTEGNDDAQDKTLTEGKNFEIEDEEKKPESKMQRVKRTLRYSQEKTEEPEESTEEKKKPVKAKRQSKKAAEEMLEQIMTEDESEEDKQKRKPRKRKRQIKRSLRQSQESDAQASEEEKKKPIKRKLKRTSRSSASESDDREDRKRKRRALAGLLLQPVVRVARVDAARKLRSANTARRGNRHR